MLPSCRLIVKGQKRGKEDSPAHEVQTKFAAASVPDKSFFKDFFNSKELDPAAALAKEMQRRGPKGRLENLKKKFSFLFAEQEHKQS